MASLRRLASTLSRFAAAEAKPACQTQGVRTFGGHAHDVPADRFVTYAGVTLQKPSPYEYYGSKLLGGFMWFWVWYRLYNDWDEKVLGLAHVFDNEGDDDDHHH